MQTKTKSKCLLTSFFGKKYLFILIASCIIIPLLLRIFTFQLDANISANAYLISPGVCLVGLLYPTFIFPFALIYILRDFPINLKKQQKEIWKFIGIIVVFAFLSCLMGTIIELLLMLLISFIPYFDPNHYLTAAFTFIFSKHTSKISQDPMAIYILFTIGTLILSYLVLVLIHTFIALVLARWIKNQTYLIFVLLIITIFNFVFSDAIMIPDIFAHSFVLRDIGYICPSRYGVWSYFFSVSGNSSAYFVFDDYYSIAKSFGSIAISLPTAYAWAIVFIFVYWLTWSVDTAKLCKKRK